jgi:hypothetical protein
MALAVATALTTGSLPVVAAGNSVLPAHNRNPVAAQVDEHALERAKAKFAHALSIADQFADQAKAAGVTGDNWRFEMVGNLMKGSEANFASVSLARSFADAIGASIAVARAGGNTVSNSSTIGATPATDASPVAESFPKVFDELVYVPITPCRILDTRAAGGGVLAALGVYSYVFSGSNVGASSSCSVASQIPSQSSNAAVAFAANVTIDDSAISGFTPGAYLQIYPQGGSTPTSFMNFGPGQIIANAGIVSLNVTNLEFSITPSAPANVIVDTYGVFVLPPQNNLSCLQVTSTNNVLGTVTVTCPASFSLTGGGCNSNSIYDHTYESNPTNGTTWGCGFYPETGQLLGSTLTAYAVCCSAP